MGAVMLWGKASHALLHEHAFDLYDEYDIVDEHEYA